MSPRIRRELGFLPLVAVMPLLEIVKGDATDDPTLATAFATGKALKKTTILVKDSPSFIVNRLLGRFMSEVGRIVDEGTPLQVADGAFGGVAPMPPFFLLSLVLGLVTQVNSRYNYLPDSSGNVKVLGRGAIRHSPPPGVKATRITAERA